MAKTRIVTDSTSCLPPGLAGEYGISVVPVGILIDGVAHRDCIDISLEELCRQMDSIDQQPTTSAVSPGDFITTFKELAQATDSIICILVSKVLTASHESAYLARRTIRAECPGVNIQIIDSKTSAGALGFIAIEAARAAEQGKSREEVAGIAGDMIPRVIYLAALETLQYLIKIGRAPKSGAIGEMLKIKPIIGLVDDSGMIEVVARVRGKSKSVARLVDLIDRYIDTDRPVHAMVHYSNGLEDAEALRDMITCRYTCAEVHLTPYTPAMVSATGPMVGASFYS